MAVYTISPCLMRNMGQNELYFFRSILFPFVNSCHKVALDQDGVVLSIYSAIEHNQDIIQTWLNLMSYTPSRFETIPVALNDIQDECSKFLYLCRYTKGQHKMIVDSIQKLNCVVGDDNCVVVENEKVKVLDKNEAVGELDFFGAEQIEDFIRNHPLSLRIKETAEGINNLMSVLCNQFKVVIESNRMYKLLYNQDGSFKGEDAVQQLFFVMAVGYCKCFNIDMSRESDTGIGLLDFKFSRGYECKVVLEIKLASNPQLLHGEQVQLPAYMKAEETPSGVYMIIKTEQKDDTLCDKLMKKVKVSEEDSLSIIIIDARSRLSASKM